jgi:hypothetical protein
MWTRFAAMMRTVVAWAVVPWLDMITLHSLARFGNVAGPYVGTLATTRSPAALSGWSRRVSARPPVRAAIRRRTRGAARAVAMRRFHRRFLYLPAANLHSRRVSVHGE